MDCEDFAYPPWWLLSESAFSWLSQLSLTRKSIICSLEIPSRFHVVDGRLNQSIRVCCIPLLFRKLSAAFWPWQMHKIDSVESKLGLTLFVSFAVVFFLIYKKIPYVKNAFWQGPNSTMLALLIYPLIPNESRHAVKVCLALRGDTQNMRCSASVMWMECGAFCVHMWHLKRWGDTIEQFAPPSDQWAVCFSLELFFCPEEESCTTALAHFFQDTRPPAVAAQPYKQGLARYMHNISFFCTICCAATQTFGKVKSNAIGVDVS